MLYSGRCCYVTLIGYNNKTSTDINRYSNSVTISVSNSILAIY